jgi:integrase/recombinase XerD
MELNKAIERFKLVHVSSLSHNTQRDYFRIFKKLISVFDPETELSDIDIFRYFEVLGDVSYKTKNNHRTYLKAFYNFCKKQKWISINLLDDIPVFKPNRAKGEVPSAGIPRQITFEQVKFLIQRSKVHGEQTGYGDLFYLLTALLLESGCRVSEALMTLERSLKKDHIYIPISKNGQPRWIYFSEDLGTKLRNYANSHGSEWLFPSTSDPRLPLPYDFFQKHFAKYRKGICNSVTCREITIHGLRHTFASLRIGMLTPFELKELMGHASIQTTLRYISNSESQLAQIWAKTESLAFS